MGKALYRKYRSKKLSEIVGQEHITSALDNALKNGKISHAYLFTGPRGVGKTSIARILAYEINGLPYDEDATHLDIIEIDAASNRRIDEIRDLRDKVRNAPSSAKYKVYIIDEVHMLTREAFNALLKTLEEPPEHAVFILATTEAHKLPETIVSRTQRYTFRPIELQKVIDHLKSIAKSEKIKISDEALELIALHGEGSFRDSISLLDQVRNTGEAVDLAAVQQSLGIASTEAINGLMTAIINRNSSAVLTGLQDMQNHGYHAPQIARQLAEKLRDGLLNNDVALPGATVSNLLRQLLQVPAAHDPLRLLEIILLETALEGQEAPAAPAPVEVQPVPQPTELPAALVVREPKAEPAPKPKASAPKAEKTTTKVQRSSSPTASLNAEGWQTILQAIKAKHNTLYSVARMAVPSFNGDEVTLAFSFPFHQKRLNDVKNKQVIQDIIHQTTGQNISLVCVVDQDARVVPAAQAQPHTPDPSLENISNIFGPTEVLE
jgi:DNA polymerase-3 subunit gamma/tau